MSAGTPTVTACAKLCTAAESYGFYEADSETGRELLEESGLAGPLTIVVLPDGSAVARPGVNEIASALGVNTDPTAQEFDVAVVGSGPAGLASAVYGASEGLNVLLTETEALGGQASTRTLIRNYLGFPRGLSGQELAGRAPSEEIEATAVSSSSAPNRTPIGYPPT